MGVFLKRSIQMRVLSLKLMPTCKTRRVDTDNWTQRQSHPLNADDDEHTLTKTTMGGGGWFYVPKVWSPAGGWWSNPPQWKRNTGIASATVGILAFMIFQVSASKERRPVPPIRHIPSQYWCKHAAEDDPRLAK